MKMVWVKWMCLSLLVVLVDQLTKFWALEAFSPYQIKEIFPVLNFTLAFNKGAAFSFLNSEGHWQNTFFIVIALVISTGLLIWFARIKEKALCERASISLILGGAIGNLIDRLHYGYVIDFIQCHIKDYYWPVFNIADSAICVGALLLLISTLKKN